MYGEWARRMAEADGAAGRRAVVADMCRMHAFGPAKAYRLLREHGWESGRARRKDAGSTSANESAVALAAGLRQAGISKDGKATMPLTVAAEMSLARGEDPGVGMSRLRQILRERKLSVADMRARAPHSSLRTEYPNQVHQADPSVSRLWFPPGGGRAKWLGQTEINRNKNPQEGKVKLWRYVLTDHYSGSVCARYYAALGETGANMWDFLLYAWGRKGIGAYAFHGLPEILMWDSGSANGAEATVNALRAFGVETRTHLPGHAWAKGSVEKGNHIVETQFESRLRHELPESMDALNEAVERWCAAWNADLIPGRDCRLRRGGRINVRTSLWLRIAPERLRELPDDETCRQVYASGIQTRKVAGNLTVGITHPRQGRSLRYSVRDLPGIVAGDVIRLQPVMTGEGRNCIALMTAEGREIGYELAPIEYDEAGFVLTAPVIGREHAAQPDTPRETAGKALAKAAPPLAGIAHSHITGESPWVRGATGTVVEVAETVHVHEIVLSAVEATRRIAAAGIDPDGWLDYFRAAYPEGVSSRVADEIIAREKARRQGAPAVGAEGWVVAGRSPPGTETEIAAADAGAEETRKTA